MFQAQVADRSITLIRLADQRSCTLFVDCAKRLPSVPPCPAGMVLVDFHFSPIPDGRFLDAREAFSAACFCLQKEPPLKRPI